MNEVILGRQKIIQDDFSPSRDEGEVSQERVWWIDNMKYWVEGVAVLVLCLAGILGSIGGFMRYKY